LSQESCFSSVALVLYGGNPYRARCAGADCGEQCFLSGGGGGFGRGGGLGGGPGGFGMLAIDICSSEDGSDRGVRSPSSVSLDIVEFGSIECSCPLPLTRPKQIGRDFGRGEIEQPVPAAGNSLSL
jgi:hypothetical protein